MTKEEQHEHIVAGLVGDRTDLYLTNTVFHQMVDTTANWLLEVVMPGTIAKAEGWDAEVKQRMAEIRSP